MKDEGQIYKTLPQTFLILPRDLAMIFQSLVMSLPRFFDSKNQNYVPRQKLKNQRTIL